MHPNGVELGAASHLLRARALDYLGGGGCIEILSGEREIQKCLVRILI